MFIMKKGGYFVFFCVMLNGVFVKCMNLLKWKQMIFGLVGCKFDKMVEKYGVYYYFIFVESNGV